MKYIIGIDIGTTATKAIAYDLNGKQILETSKAYPLIQNVSGQAEEDPKIIFDAVQETIFQISKKLGPEALAISWSSQMHSLIGLDDEGNLLTNSITWADNRADSEVELAKESGQAKAIYQKTGMPMHPMAPVYKLKWLKNTNLDLYKKVDKWIGIKDYIIYRLTGKIMEDIPMAAGSGLLDLQTLNWDDQLLDWLELSKHNLPTLAKATEVVGTINEDYLQKLSLSENTKIVLGSSDGYLSTIGVGVLNNQEFALNVGTSGAIRTLESRPMIDEKARFFCYPAEKDYYLIGGPVNNGGIIFDWAKKTLFSADETAEDFLDIAQTVPAGSGGLIFHPYLGGERSPIWDANAKGSFVGLTRNHTKPHLARSVIEGIIFNLYEAMSAIRTCVAKPKAMRITGGFVKSDFVRQILANVFNLPIIAMRNDQSGSLAAMFLARLGLGLDNELSDIKKFINEDKVYFPNLKEVEIYQKIIPIYHEIGLELSKSYFELANFQNNYPNLFSE